MVSASNFLKVGGLRNFAPCCHSSPRCINGYWGHNAGGGGGGGVAL